MSTTLDHADVDDVQLSRVCVAIGSVYVAVTFPVIVFNFLEYFLPTSIPSCEQKLQTFLVSGEVYSQNVIKLSVVVVYAYNVDRNARTKPKRLVQVDWHTGTHTLRI